MQIKSKRLDCIEAQIILFIAWFVTAPDRINLNESWSNRMWNLCPLINVQLKCATGWTPISTWTYPSSCKYLRVICEGQTLDLKFSHRGLIGCGGVFALKTKKIYDIKIRNLFFSWSIIDKTAKSRNLPRDFRFIIIVEDDGYNCAWDHPGRCPNYSYPLSHESRIWYRYPYYCWVSGT